MVGIGEKLKTLAADNQMSLKNLAEASGIPYPSMQNYSSGKQLPGAGALIKLAGTVRVDLNWLLDVNADDFPTNKTVNRIDFELFAKVIEEVRADDSELRGAKLELLLQEIITIYNSVAGLPPDEQQRSIRAQVLMMSTIAIKNSLPREEEFARRIGSQETLELFAKHKQETMNYLAELEQKLEELQASAATKKNGVEDDTGVGQ